VDKVLIFDSLPVAGVALFVFASEYVCICICRVFCLSIECRWKERQWKVDTSKDERKNQGLTFCCYSWSIAKIKCLLNTEITAHLPNLAAVSITFTLCIFHTNSKSQN